MRSQIVGVVKGLLASRGRVLMPACRYDLDPLMDVKRLTSAWKYPMDTIFDVGANDGDTALNLLQEFPTARICSFEPPSHYICQAYGQIRWKAALSGIQCCFGRCNGRAEMTEYEESKVRAFSQLV